MSENFLSLEWFKSTTEKAIEKAVLKKLKKVIKEEKQEEVLEKPYITVKLVNDVLIVVLPDGNVLTKSNASEKDFYLALNSKTEKELRIILASEKVIAELEAKKKEEEKIIAIQKGIKMLENLEDFIVINNTVFFKGTSRSMPQLLVEKFIEIVDRVSEQTSGDRPFEEVLNNDDEYLAHKNFFMWCCLNPRAEVADELYRFLTENSFRITKQGFFVALRNVVTLQGSPELVHFVSNTYNKVKAVWKKNPNEYTVFLENGEYKLVHDDKLTETKTFTSTTCPECDGNGNIDDWNEEYEECLVCDGTGEVKEYEYTAAVPVNYGEKIGNLVELYLDLPNREENRFTDDWTKTFDIRVGQVTSMPMEECNWSTQDCAAAGLHFTSNEIHYVGCGDQSVLILINPMKIVGIGQHKGRCYEYLPIMTVPREEATQILHDGMFDTLQLDEEYAIRELESLEEKAKEGFAKEAKKYEFNIPAISQKEINNITLSLSEMKNKITKRVSTIK